MGPESRSENARLIRNDVRGVGSEAKVPEQMSRDLKSRLKDRNDGPMYVETSQRGPELARLSPEVRGVSGKIRSECRGARIFGISAVRSELSRGDRNMTVAVSPF